MKTEKHNIYYRNGVCTTLRLVETCALLVGTESPYYQGALVGEIYALAHELHNEGIWKGYLKNTIELIIENIGDEGRWF